MRRDTYSFTKILGYEFPEVSTRQKPEEFRKSAKIGIGLLILAIERLLAV
jgi:hypothetical protein